MIFFELFLNSLKLIPVIKQNWKTLIILFKKAFVIFEWIKFFLIKLKLRLKAKVVVTVLEIWIVDEVYCYLKINLLYNVFFWRAWDSMELQFFKEFWGNFYSCATSFVEGIFLLYTIFINCFICGFYRID